MDTKFSFLCTYLTVANIVASLYGDLSAVRDVQLATLVLGGEELLVDGAQTDGARHRRQRPLGANLELLFQLGIVIILLEIFFSHRVCKFKKTPH